MKKKIILFLTICMFLLPFSVKAASNDYQVQNLDETLTEEEIEHDFTNYKETDDQITIYLFRGRGCGYCRAFLTFLNSIVDEYGKYFKVRTYEVWYDEANSNLLTETSKYLDNPAEGVPYIIIGNKVFPGYANKMDDEIKSAIVDLYNSKEKYDVFYEMEHNPKMSSEQIAIETLKNSRTILAVSIVILVITIVIGSTNVIVSLKSNAKIQEQLNNIEQNVFSLKKEVKNTTAKEVKATANKDNEKKSKKKA